jgi:hypothetical protein
MKGRISVHQQNKNMLDYWTRKFPFCQKWEKCYFLSFWNLTLVLHSAVVFWFYLIIIFFIGFCNFFLEDSILLCRMWI